MDERQRRIFINYDPSDPRPNRTQRQAVSAYIGKHFRNRSAPARRAQQTPNGSENRLLPQSLVPSVEAQGRLVIRGSQFLHSSNEDDRHSIEHNAGPEAPESPGSNIGNSIILLRPVIECFVPAYPTEHREKVFDVLDFHIHYLAARLTHWGPGANPFVRCWVQMVCGDMALFDSVAAFTHGVRITTLEDKITPSTTMLWHKARALKALQAKISPQAEDKVATWTANETILATFYLMEGAARFGYESEFKAHCLGLLRMMQLRGQVASGCLKDLYVMQAVGLVEGTEMASSLKHDITQESLQLSSNKQADGTSVTATMALRYPQPVIQLDRSLKSAIDTLPEGFRDLAISGNLSADFIFLLGEQSQQYDDITQSAERQTKGIKGARLLANRSQSAVEQLACLGTVAFLTRRTAQMQMFPEVARINRLAMLASQMPSFSKGGTLCYRELRVWATLVGTEISITAGATLKQRARQLMMDLVLQERWIGGWIDVERIVKRYLWDEKSLAAWKRHWANYQDLNQV
ncbi:hypothetical protein N5P37_007599 [Trichoderma harzianum]|uniref:Uncharacterized protein n=1 Tax=Trichoderma harzianum CBS 226.95 TaxID=983964 RepID=A0A2T3ZV46_TRIHA|nr:hypothetical protein M431DRAFT_10637 [Trichoderma harzianum CBS 226.95]KAK0759411.1 hypothetical protein N5P37_007599 [Trichoderma harzianum]PKK53953.1 hypothetical protein CI102_1128 [Trichoderma harzianum]PTB48682.1 hypothetical protein M431DRAFT_10637 [Trichoderma harzianum CBS 226.95]